MVPLLSFSYKLVPRMTIQRLIGSGPGDCHVGLTYCNASFTPPFPSWKIPDPWKFLYGILKQGVFLMWSFYYQVKMPYAKYWGICLGQNRTHPSEPNSSSVKRSESVLLATMHFSFLWIISRVFACIFSHSISLVQVNFCNNDFVLGPYRLKVIEANLV